jgi:hypothetical protein
MSSNRKGRLGPRPGAEGGAMSLQIKAVDKGDKAIPTFLYTGCIGSLVLLCPLCPPRGFGGALFHLFFALSPRSSGGFPGHAAPHSHPHRPPTWPAFRSPPVRPLPARPRAPAPRFRGVSRPGSPAPAAVQKPRRAGARKALETKPGQPAKAAAQKHMFLPQGRAVTAGGLTLDSGRTM